MPATYQLARPNLRIRDFMSCVKYSQLNSKSAKRNTLVLLPCLEMLLSGIGADHKLLDHSQDSQVPFHLVRDHRTSA